MTPFVPYADEGSFLGAENIRLTDIAPALYVSSESQRPLESIEQIEEDLWTWWAEADIQPSPILLFVDSDTVRDKYGNDLVLQAEAASVIRKGRVEEERVNAEVAGVRQLRRLITSGKAENGIIYLSPPGSPQEGFGKAGRRRLSFTYLYKPERSGKVRFVAVPEPEVSVADHIDRIRTKIDEVATAELLGPLIHPHSDRLLVSYPFLGKDEHSLDLAAQDFHYENFEDMWKRAEDAKNLRGRVGGLIQHASREIWSASVAKDIVRLEVLGEVFRGVVALAVSQGMEDVDDINHYFDKKVAALLHSCRINTEGGVTHAALSLLTDEIEELTWRIRRNSRAVDILEGGNCPGNKGIQLGSESILADTAPEPSNHVLLDVLNPLGPETETSSDTMDCVECPFCHEIVDAIVTSSKIKCPKCHEEVSRG